MSSSRTGAPVGANDHPVLPGHADIVFLGAGHNALVSTVYLLDAGRGVVLLEQMSEGAATWPAAGASGSSGRAVARALINATDGRRAAIVSKAGTK
jgi:phytoene dehydrogenase-like protein